MGDILFNVYAVIVMFLLFGLTIFVHEFGHFIAAIKLGLVVETFSIGFGPAIWKKKHKGVLYKIGCIPFGGYVALPQLDPGAMEGIQGKNKKDEKSDPEKKDEDSDAEKKDEKEEIKEYPEVAFWKKVIVAAAGAFGNVLLAILLAWIIFLHPGAITGELEPLTMKVDQQSAAYASGLRSGQDIISVEGEDVAKWQDFMIECHLNSGATNLVEVTVASDGEQSSFMVPTKKIGKVYFVLGVTPLNPPPCKIGPVTEGKPAEKAGIQPGDIIEEFNTVKVRDWEHFIELVPAAKDNEVPVKITRRGKSIDLSVTPEMDEELGQVMIGVGYANEVIPGWMQYKQPMDQIEADAKGIWRILRALTSKKKGVAKQAAGALGGPPKIFHILLISIKISFLSGLGFIRFLNINLAILNMLPIPVLDGGHIMFALWEGVTRRKPHPRVVNVLVNIFVVLLIGAMLILSSRDIVDMVSDYFRSDDAVIEEVIEEVKPSEIDMASDYIPSDDAVVEEVIEEVKPAEGE